MEVDKLVFQSFDQIAVYIEVFHSLLYAPAYFPYIYFFKFFSYFAIIEKAISDREIKAQDSLIYYMLAASNPGAREYIYANLEKFV